MEYNTTRNFLVMREYGRHIKEKMIEYLPLQLEDKEKRQRNACAVIELMGFLNPHLKKMSKISVINCGITFSCISDFKLEVASPYPIPTRETLKAKAKSVEIPQPLSETFAFGQKPRNRHQQSPQRKKIPTNATDLPTQSPII